jgi:hypothetical protein
MINPNLNLVMGIILITTVILFFLPSCCCYDYEMGIEKNQNSSLRNQRIVHHNY